MAEFVAGGPKVRRSLHVRGPARGRPTVHRQAVPRRTVVRRADGRLTPDLGTLGSLFGVVVALSLAISLADATSFASTPDGMIPPVRRPVVDASALADVSVPASTSGDESLGVDLGAITRVPDRRDVSSALGWYRLAAAEHGVSEELLRALHQVESNAAADGCIANAKGSGAVGPFQFKRATFRQYGVDADQDGVRNICAFADALFSAARYLRALGAGGLDDGATRRALARYGTDPDRVLVLARSCRDRAAGAS